MSPRPIAKDDKYEQKSEFRPKPVIKPVVSEELRASGNQFCQRIRAGSGDEVATLLSKHGFLSNTYRTRKSLGLSVINGRL